MEDAEKPIAEASTGIHTARTEDDICELVISYLENIKGEPLDEERYRNAGEIIVTERDYLLKVRIPLPYFHHLNTTPEYIEDKLKSHFPSSLLVDVGFADPPTDDTADDPPDDV